MNGGRLPRDRDATSGLSWAGVVRLGLVQAGIGAVVVLATSTLARLMTVELALPALVPGVLVGLQYLVQLARPRWGHGSDRRGTRTPFILGGMALTAGGGVLAAAGVATWPASPGGAALLLLLGFLTLGVGVGGCGTALLALLAERTAPERRGPAATVTWFLMMVGFIVSAGVAGAALKPYSPLRLVEVSAAVGLASVLLAALGTFGIKGRNPEAFSLDGGEAGIGVGARRPWKRAGDAAASSAVRLDGGAPTPTPALPSSRGREDFRAALEAVWAEPHTRRFAAVVFLAMLAYAGQELVLEPLAGAVFGLSPGASTQLMGVQRGGVLIGMAALGLASGVTRGRRFGLPAAMAGACAAAALALGALAFGALKGQGFPLRPGVFALGLADGVFATAAVGAMMAGVGAGDGQAGLRMGLWGAAQALAYAAGGLLATSALQLGRAVWTGASGPAFALTFAVQALLFVAAAVLMARLSSRPRAAAAVEPPSALAKPA